MVTNKVLVKDIYAIYSEILMLFPSLSPFYMPHSQPCEYDVRPFFRSLICLKTVVTHNAHITQELVKFNGPNTYLTVIERNILYK